MDEKRTFVEILSEKKAKVIDEKISRYYQFIFRDAEGKIIKEPEYKLNEWEEESRPPFKRDLPPKKDVEVEFLGVSLPVSNFFIFFILHFAFNPLFLIHSFTHFLLSAETGSKFHFLHFTPQYIVGA